MEEIPNNSQNIGKVAMLNEALLNKQNEKSILVEIGRKTKKGFAIILSDPQKMDELQKLDPDDHNAITNYAIKVFEETTLSKEEIESLVNKLNEIEGMVENKEEDPKN